MRDNARTGLPEGPDVETETISGLAVPTTCSDRVDDELLDSAVAILDEYSVTDYTVSPVGGLKIYVGIRRPDAVHDRVRESLDRLGGEVTEHGIADGFYRLRFDLTAAVDDTPSSDSSATDCGP